MAKILGHTQTAILTTLQVAGIVTLAVLAPNAIQLLDHFGITEVRKKRLKYEIPKSLKLLEKKKLIRKTSKGYQLTEKGNHILDLTFQNPPRRPNRWDGKWRIVIFDIPEHKRVSRDRLRNLIRTYGFQELQRSVWIYPYHCEDLIEILKVELLLGDELQYLVTQSFEGDQDLRSRFDI